MTTRRVECHAEFKNIDPETRLIEGYASTGDLDSHGEIIHPEAFEGAVDEYMRNAILLYQHRWREDPIGKVNYSHIDEKGLFVKAQISETAEKQWKLIQEGILQAFSIGFDIVEEDRIDGVWHILKVRLYEVSVVSLPANRHALFSVTKALRDGTDLVCADCTKHTGQAAIENVKIELICSKCAQPIQPGFDPLKRPGGILVTDASLTDDERARLQRQWEAAHKGPKEADEILCTKEEEIAKTLREVMSDVEEIKGVSQRVVSIITDKVTEAINRL